jgi:hypothetical protein
VGVVPGKNPVERAFEIARAGKRASVSEVKQQLASEGYSLNDFVGPSLNQQLRAIIKDAKAKPSG